ncbi:MAG: Gfo/Idh/MocA family protein, partial [Armatimonadota bacterium]
MMDTLGYGVIGCGRVSSRHMDAAETVAGLELVAIADANVSKVQSVAEERSSNPTPYADYRELLADDAVDVVVIAVPTHLHAEVTVAAAEAGKHIYCEKAMAPTLQECRQMISATDEAGVKLMIGQSTRYRRPFMQARRLIERGEIGDVVAVDASFSGTATTKDDVPEDFWRFKKGAQGHGYVVNFGCHYIDTSRFLCGQDPAAITALIDNRFSQGVIPEDQFVITCKCRDEAI